MSEHDYDAGYEAAEEYYYVIEAARVKAGYDAGHDAGYREGFAAGFRVAGMHYEAIKLADNINAAMDQRIDALLKEHGIEPLQDYMNELVAEERAEEAARIAAKKAFAQHLLHDPVPVYQGRLVMCASCGNPIGDSPVQKNEYGNIFLYCSESCRDYHAVGA